MSPYLTIIVFIIKLLDKLSETLSKKHKLDDIKNVEKIVDTHNDVALAQQLRDIADKVEQRQKTA
jgi:hypothetical protein